MSTITPIFEDNGKTSFAEEFKDKVRLLHEQFDKDKDGFLNFPEIRSLQLHTSGEDMDENNYVMVCRALDCHPNKGISVDALRLTYASEGANIDEDFLLVFSEKKKEKDNGKEKEDEDVIEIGDGGFDISPE